MRYSTPLLMPLLVALVSAGMAPAAPQGQAGLFGLPLGGRPVDGVEAQRLQDSQEPKQRPISAGGIEGTAGTFRGPPVGARLLGGRSLYDLCADPARPVPVESLVLITPAQTQVLAAVSAQCEGFDEEAQARQVRGILEVVEIRRAPAGGGGRFKIQHRGYLEVRPSDEYESPFLRHTVEGRIGSWGVKFALPSRPVPTTTSPSVPVVP